MADWYRWFKIYNKLRTNDDIRFKPKKVEKACDKVSLIIQVPVSFERGFPDVEPSLQAILGGISLSGSDMKNGDNQPSLEALTIFRHVARIARGKPSE